MGVPIVHPGQLSASEHGVSARIGGERIEVHVLYRRLDENDLAATLDAGGGLLLPGLLAAARAGRLTLANALGNGLADSKALYAYVPELIRFYLGEEPVLPNVPTYRFDDPAQRPATLARLPELVVKPVHGAGGRAVVFGSQLTADELTLLREQITADPAGYVAQEPVAFTTHPTLLDGRLVPRFVDLRVFTVAGTHTRVLPLPLTRVALRAGSRVVNSSQGGGAKDTWLPYCSQAAAMRVPDQRDDG
jgi:carboxylate-amine ligase